MRGAKETLQALVGRLCVLADPPALQDRQVPREEEEKKDNKVPSVKKDQQVHRVPRDPTGHQVLQAK